VAQAVPFSNADLVLVATLVSGDLLERLPDNSPSPSPGPETFTLFLAPGLTTRKGPDGGGGEQPGESLPGEEDQDRLAVPPWQGYELGVDEALRGRELERQLRYQVEDVWDYFRKLGEQWQGWLKSFTNWPELGETGQPVSAIPHPPPSTEDQASAPAGLNETGEGAAPTSAVEPGWALELFEHPETLPNTGDRVASSTFSGSDDAKALPGNLRPGDEEDSYPSFRPVTRPPVVRLSAARTLTPSA
jgi:hypothetical protein